MNMTNEDIGKLHAAKLARWTLILIILGLALFASIVLTLCIGSVYIPPAKVFSILFGGVSSTDPDNTIIMNIRLPRILLGALVGASLSVAGVAMQGIFKNPMASPSVIGISQGAAFGAALVIVFGISFTSGSLAIPSMAFVFALGTMFLVYVLSKVEGYVPTTTLLLAGIAVGAFFSALVALLQFVVSTIQGRPMDSVVFWLMGGLNHANWEQVWIVLPFLLVGGLLMMFFARDLNAMILGESHASSLGVDPQRTIKVMLLGSSLVTAAAVAFAGIIAFVGLIIPHIMRMIIGPDNRVLFPAALLAGAIFMIWTDTVARAAFPSEIPVGIITAILGGPFFLWLLRRKREATEW